MQDSQSYKVQLYTKEKRPKNSSSHAGDAALSQLVNAAIGFKPLYSVMKFMAKQMMQTSAEKNGVPWQQRVKDLRNTPEVRLAVTVYQTNR